MIKEKPLASVIMNCYNGEEFLKEAIDSVLAQTYTNFEIIFWNNQSTDRSREIVTGYNDKRIKYFLGEKHVPLGEARNLALEKVSGDYICFLDVDDRWDTDKLTKQIPYFTDASIGLVYCQSNIINSKSKIVGHYNGNNMSKKFNSISFYDLFANYDIVMSSAIITKKALLSTAQKFDNLLVFAEEFDLFMRICSKHNAIRVEYPLTLYRIHENQDTLKLFERSIFEEEYIIAKLRLLYPNLFTPSSELLIKRNKKLAWHYFLNYILKNNAVAARRKMLPYVFSSIKYLVFYLLSFFGAKPIKYIWIKYREKNGKVLFYS